MATGDTIFREYRISDAERSDRSAGDRLRHRQKVRESSRESIAAASDPWAKNPGSEPANLLSSTSRETKFDGTKLPIVVREPQNHYLWCGHCSTPRLSR